VRQIEEGGVAVGHADTQVSMIAEEVQLECTVRSKRTRQTPEVSITDTATGSIATSSFGPRLTPGGVVPVPGSAGRRWRCK
jgi:hypothetical protein